MLLQLGLDILWTNLFPLLDINDLFNLYLSHPELKGAIQEYKNWDAEYERMFTCDYIQVQASSALTKLFKRSHATPYLWGQFIAKPKGTLIDTSCHGFLNESYSPNPIRCTSLGPIRQFISDRAVLLCNGKVLQWSRLFEENQTEVIFESGDDEPDTLDNSDYDDEYGSIITTNRGAWIRELGWPDQVDKLYPNSYEAHGIKGNILYHQQPAERVVGVEFDHQVLDAMFTYSMVYVLLKGKGLLTGMAQYHPEAYHDTLPESLFPEPMKSFCLISGVAYAFLSESNQVYTVVSGTIEINRVNFPCDIRSIVSFDLRYEMREDEGNEGWVCWSGLSRIKSVGLMALGVDGKVYYYDSEFGVLEKPIPYLDRIVKLVSKGTTLLALNEDGEVFIMGHTDMINPGFGFTGHGDYIEPDPRVMVEAEDVDMYPDVTKIWMHPECVSQDPAIRDFKFSKLYLVLPRKVPLPSPAVDVNIYGTQVSTLLVPK